MKRASLYIYLVSLALLLSACGSNNIEDPVSAAEVEEVNGYSFSETVDMLNINSYKAYNIKFKLSKDGFALPTAAIRFKTFDSEFGTIETTSTVTDENGLGSFTYYPPVTMLSSGTSKTIQYVYQSIDENGESEDLIQNITLNFDFDVNKEGNGRATTLSISYTSSECTKQGIVGHYYVHAVDKYSRLPMVGIPVSMSLINGVVMFNGTKVHRSSGNIRNSNPHSFIDNSINFASQTNVKSGDNLIIFPSEGKTDISYIGGWSITRVTNKLTFYEKYLNITNTNGLTYIIGNEERLLGGSDGARGILTVAHVEQIDAVTDSRGYAFFDITFDAILSGHTVTVEAHGDEDGKRYGISSRETLRMDNYSATDIEVDNIGGESTYAMHLSINPSCLGQQPLIDVPVSPASFIVEPKENCWRAGGMYHTDDYGNVYVTVGSDGNTSATETCTVKWEGGIHSLRHEY